MKLTRKKIIGNIAYTVHTYTHTNALAQLVQRRSTSLGSALATKDKAVPDAFPLAVRPMRWVYAAAVSGKSKLMTKFTPLKSMPRDTPYPSSPLSVEIFFDDFLSAFFSLVLVVVVVVVVLPCPSCASSTSSASPLSSSSSSSPRSILASVAIK